jgi:hypothetical protein
MTSEFNVERIEDRQFCLTLGDDMVIIGGSDDMSNDDVIARGLEMLGVATGQEIVPAREGALVLDIPKFESKSKASTPAKVKKD